LTCKCQFCRVWRVQKPRRWWPSGRCLPGRHTIQHYDIVQLVQEPYYVIRGACSWQSPAANVSLLSLAAVHPLCFRWSPAWGCQLPRVVKDCPNSPPLQVTQLNTAAFHNEVREETSTEAHRLTTTWINSEMVHVLNKHAPFKSVTQWVGGDDIDCPCRRLWLWADAAEANMSVQAILWNVAKLTHKSFCCRLAKVPDSLKDSCQPRYPVKIQRHQKVTQQQPTYTSRYQALTLSKIIERLELDRLSPWLLMSSNFAHLLNSCQPFHRDVTTPRWYMAAYNRNVTALGSQPRHIISSVRQHQPKRSRQPTGDTVRLRCEGCCLLLAALIPRRPTPVPESTTAMCPPRCRVTGVPQGSMLHPLLFTTSHPWTVCHRMWKRKQTVIESRSTFTMDFGPL